MNPANYSVISFPALGISLNPPRGFSVGPLYIHFYGLIIACGLMLAVYYACKRSRQAGLDEDTLLDGVLWVTPFTILCARAYYCAFSWSLYKNNPISVLYIWEGGLAIYGGVLGAAIGVALFCKIKKCSLPAGSCEPRLSDWAVHGTLGQLLQPGGLRRRHGGLHPHGTLQYRHRRDGILPPHLSV